MELTIKDFKKGKIDLENDLLVSIRDFENRFSANVKQVNTIQIELSNCNRNRVGVISVEIEL